MELAYEIRRSSKRRKLTITVERDRRVIVHAPITTSEAKIREIVETKRLWIYEKLHHPQKYRELPHAPGKELVSGESILFLGKHYRIEIVRSGQSGISLTHHFRIPDIERQQQKILLEKWYRKKAHEKILPKLMYYAKQLGVSFNEAKIVDQRYRWGSCSPQKNIRLNWRIIKAPMFVIDYILIHELAHLLEANHTPRFWNIVRTQTPTFEKAKHWLKEHGQELEKEF